MSQSSFGSSWVPPPNTRMHLRRRRPFPREVVEVGPQTCASVGGNMRAKQTNVVAPLLAVLLLGAPCRPQSLAQRPQQPTLPLPEVTPETNLLPEQPLWNSVRAWHYNPQMVRPLWDVWAAFEEPPLSMRMKVMVATVTGGSSPSVADRHSRVRFLGQREDLAAPGRADDRRPFVSARPGRPGAGSWLERGGGGAGDLCGGVLQYVEPHCRGVCPTAGCGSSV